VQETTVDWSLPDGARAAPIQWAVPERIRVGELANYGYAEEVGLVVELLIPPTWPVGTPMPVKADVAWLECESICIPSYATFVLSIPTGSATILSDDVAPMFAAARAALPAPTSWRAKVRGLNNTVTIRIEGPGMRIAAIKSAYFFPAEWGVIDHAADQEFIADKRGLTLTVAAGDI
jgi:thiol:disulfide interchange protein DsbD